MNPDRDPRLVDQVPERIESRVGGGGETGRRVGGSTLYADDPRVSGEDAAQLGHRRIDADEGDHRRREDALFVGVTPVVLEPPVECFESGDQGGRIVRERLLHPDTKRWEQEATIKALTIHDGQTSVSITVLGTDWLEIAKERPNVLCARVLPSEVLVEAARLCDRVEHRI